MFGKDLTQVEAEALVGKEPIVALVNRKGIWRGWAREKEVHERGNRRMHKAMQIFVWSPDKEEIIIKFNRSGESANMWSAVGTHIYYAEDYYSAAARELNMKLGLGLTMRSARDRLRFIFAQDPCLGTKMEHINLYSFVLNSGEAITSREPLLSLTYERLRKKSIDPKFDDIIVAPAFRLLLNRFEREFIKGLYWRNVL